MGLGVAAFGGSPEQFSLDTAIVLPLVPVEEVVAETIRWPRQ